MNQLLQLSRLLCFSLLCFTLLCLTPSVYAKTFNLHSPNGEITLTIVVPKSISAQDPVRYSVAYGQASIIENAQAWLTIASSQDDSENNNKYTTNTYGLVKTKTTVVDRLVYPVVKQKSAEIREHYQEITLTFDRHLSLAFRVFNDGVGYRFKSEQSAPFRVTNELADFNFGDNFTADSTDKHTDNNIDVMFSQETSFISHNERLYVNKRLSEISSQQFASLPLLVSKHDIKMVITETALNNYPGMWLNGTDSNSLTAIFPHYVLANELKQGSDRNEHISKRAQYLADYPNIQSPKAFPWRIIALAKEDKALLTNQLSYLLAEPDRLATTDWIKPGKVAWDWWNANNIYGVDFKSGINTQTYKYYIDFAAKYGLEYILLDEGWYQLGDVLAISPDIDVQEIINYGKSKNVAVILWVIWHTLDQQLEQALDTFKAWGAAGIKVDFMQRDDQAMVQYYWRVAEQAAKRQLLVNFHGSYKPAGLRRTYPNVITREGLRGLEHNKWADYITSRHNLTLPFIRMLAGPMDYTPGAMVNRQPKNFSIAFDRPMSQTTRAHQVAMYIIYESPLQMLADSPSNYLKAHATTQFISEIPTVWDETKVLFAKMSDHIISARRSGDTWFIGAMNNEQPKSFTIDLTFLADTQYQLVLFKDGINADRYASDHQIQRQIITNKQQLSLALAANGGWAAKLTPLTDKAIIAAQGER